MSSIRVRLTRALAWSISLSLTIFRNFGPRKTPITTAYSIGRRTSMPGPILNLRIPTASETATSARTSKCTFTFLIAFNMVCFLQFEIR